MNGKIQRSIDEGLAFSGFTVLYRKIMFELRPDLWSSQLNAASDFVWTEIENYIASRPRVTIYEVRFVGSEDEWVPVAARSEDSLADRVGWLTGMDVAAVRPFIPGRRVATAPRAPAADDEIPDWPSQARTEALEKAGLKETRFAKPAGGKYR